MRRCERVWEVEAARDGRISGEDRARVERHIAGCTDCERERAALAALENALRAVTTPGSDELCVRRRRHQLLRRANGEHLAAARPRIRGAWVAASLLALVAGGGLRWYAGTRTAPPPPAAPQRALSNVIVKADPGALFVRERRDGQEIIDLRAGRVTVIVTHEGSGRGVVVRTPDGSVEDVGTTFAVSVREGRTAAVEVFEGRVFARIAGRALKLLGAGDLYQPYPITSAVEPALPKAQRTPAAHADVGSKARHAQRAPAQETKAPDLAAPAPAMDEFADAFAAFEAGEMSRAAALFFQYEARHRDEIRAEDAAFLRVVALIRAGRALEADFAARTYLHRYPNGFRARDVQRLLTTP